MDTYFSMLAGLGIAGAGMILMAIVAVWYERRASRRKCK